MESGVNDAFHEYSVKPAIGKPFVTLFQYVGEYWTLTAGGILSETSGIPTCDSERLTVSSYHSHQGIPCSSIFLSVFLCTLKRAGLSTTENSEISQFLTIEEENNKLIFTLRRELVSAEWSTIEQVGEAVLAPIEEKKKPQVLMDLSQLEHMGSSMVAMLVRVWKEVKEKDGTIVFVSEQNGIYEVLKLAGLAKVWTIKDNRQDALNLLGSTAERTGRNLSVFLVVVSFFAAALSGAMLATILTDRHYIGAVEEPKIQIAAGIVSGVLGIWAFIASQRVTRILGLVFGLTGLGLAVQALVN